MAAYPVCRVCLAINVNLLPIADTPLQFVYERLTNALLHTEDMRPLSACYMCYALLRKSYKLMLTSVTAENVLNEIVKRNSKITIRSVSLVDRKANKLGQSLVISPPECIDSTPRTPATANPVQHPRPGGEALGNTNTTPGPAIEIKVEEEQEIKTEYEFEEMEASLSPPEAPPMDDDMAMDTNIEMSEVQQEPVVRIELSWNEPGMSGDQPVEETRIAAKQLASGQQTLRLCIPRLPGEKTHECTICHRQFKYYNVYKNHLRTHTGEKPFTCHLCERKFSISANLASHLKTHTSEKPFECVLCNKQYRRLDHLKRHIETHAGEKPFQCTVCNRRFARKYHLKRHSTVHMDEKLFECNVCQSRFNNNHNLQYHLRTHTGEKLYSCDVCKRQFKVKDTLRNHLMENNGLEVFKCKKCKQDYHYRSRKGGNMCKKCCLKRKRKPKNNM